MITLSGQSLAYELEVIKEDIFIVASKNKKEIKDKLKISIQHLDLIIRLLDSDDKIFDVPEQQPQCDC